MLIPKDTMPKLYLIDGMSIVFRAYYAMEQSGLTSPEGMPTGAIFSFVNIITSLLEKLHPTDIAVAFDCRQPTFRHKLYADYKANRREFPEDLSPQLPYIKEFLQLIGITCIEQPGYEADDIIGTLSAQAAENNMEVYCVTSDKDFYQLLNKNVSILRIAKNISEFETITVDNVKEKFGVEAHAITDYLALIGDASDNVPGVKGVGEKTAIPLLEQFGTVENIYQNINAIEKERTKTLLNESKEMAFLSKQLVIIDTNVPLPVDSSALNRTAVNYDKLDNFFQKLNFKQLREKWNNVKMSDTPAFSSIEHDDDALLGKYVDIRATDAPLDNINTFEHKYILIDLENVNEMLADIANLPILALSLETDISDRNNNNIIGISFCNNENVAYYLPLDLTKKQPVDSDEELFDNAPKDKSIGYFAEYILEDLKIILEREDIFKIGHNIKETAYILRRYNIKLASILFDTAIAGHLLQNSDNVKLKELAEKYLYYATVNIEHKNVAKEENFGLNDLTAEEKLNYFAEKTNLIFRLYKTLPKQLSEDNLYYVAENIEFPLIEILTDMEFTGISIDTTQLANIGTTVNTDITQYKEAIFALAGEDFNLDSPKQVSDILFNKLGLPVNNKSNPSTNLQTLTELVSDYPIASYILEYRKLAKIKTSYIDSLPKLLNKQTNRIHTTFNQTVTNTGRLSSTEPNLQNIPIRTDLGKEVRAAFVAKSADHLILAADYSQIELRIMAYLSNDQTLIEAFQNNVDIHVATACAINNCEPEQVNSDMRRVAKTVNFGIIYGLGGFGLSQQLKISRAQADSIIKSYFEMFSGVKKYIAESLAKVRQTGYAETMTGRKRYYPAIHHKNYNIRAAAERAAINMPIQGSASDLIKTAMINIYQVLKYNKMQTKMLLQVHDELVFEVPKEERDTIVELVNTQMLYSFPLGDIPLAVSMGEGQNWLEAHA